MLACSRESQKNSRVAVLCSDDSIASYDVVAARMVEQVRDAVFAWLSAGHGPAQNRNSGNTALCVLMARFYASIPMLSHTTDSGQQR